MKAEKELVGEEMGAEAVGTDMEVFQVEGPMEKALRKKDLVSYRKGKFNMCVA